ncbi:polysaccharide biosynthesis protein [Acetatifactor muris]|uniref:Stage V sporulation protein B n=1 Tax=Acetatifactor muris TaxID=879566 RepID=A0A2K4ZNA4_9FIRM|nr:polysaccharide biosynthesis protein [Acetatifactor muris]MCI8799838.1 polysaccharide biosynthesis protein [Lachnospiraceae bacterium]MCR2050241.1 polysaccharide biosynthesis protein [Acetatifactor muris]SOY31925.1 Stage V sporulation protein B [Acetatifactor muris]
MKTRTKHPLIVGTFILTVTGIISRLIGFLYRIYLSRLFGEEGMGIYQLLSPVLSLSFSLTAAGYQTAISKLVAEQTATRKRPSLRPLAAGLSISLPLSLVCNAALFFFADFISANLLREPRTASMLRILSFSVPFAAVHSCINGYFYGIKKAGIPAGAQLLEQATRVGCVYIVSAWFLAQGRALSINVAVLGLTVGELFSMFLTIAAISPYGFPLWKKGALLRQAQGFLPPSSSSGQILYGKLLAMALPLTANRIVLNFLQSIESVSIPTQLKHYGYDTITALSVYGVFTGMAMPFIYFPNALTGSVAVLLLPIISENYALGNMDAVKKATLRTIKYCGLMGICCMGVFVSLGRWAGTTLFDSPLAGYFITTLGFICPFLYLDTTLSSILQGLGLAGHIFVINVLCLLVRLGFVFLAVPRFGITGYLWGLLVSQLALGILYLGCLNRFLKKAHKSARHFCN